ncbi:hypothetical protein [Ramlibacter humi]|uniref:Uncharacterized protein n=1 Tax=Ramlibacter humi TaxID=2530451 RepID=A0A4Z0CEV6_9BURK|nr:hypothetical protein [Ramlibacter humi]TFZ08939.1 hypothetical protein EZ216_07295 [Ramlibacter humi]
MGPYVEALVLRKTIGALSFDRRGGERHELLSKAAKNDVAAAYSPGLGAFFLGEAGVKAANNSLLFGESLARAVSEAGLTGAASSLLKGATVELLTNVHEHAGPNARGIGLYEVFEGGVAVCVADAGQGIVAGYVSANPGLSGLTAEQALIKALVEHKSRLPDQGRGTGYKTVANAMRSLDATLRVRSGDASLEIEGHPDDAEWLSREQVELRGFVVSLALRWA